MKYENKADFEKIKNEIMRKLGVSNDNQLARSLGYTSNSAIAEWNKKLSIPDKMLREHYDINEYTEPKEDIFTSQNYTFDLLNVKASAGKGINNYEIEVIDKVVLDKTFFRTPPNTNKIKMIEVVGDSMLPTLLPGDFVLIDESKCYSIDGIYAIQLHEQILIKRLKFKLDGTIDIISDNIKYSMESYNPQESQIPLNIIGMKTLSIQR